MEALVHGYGGITKILDAVEYKTTQIRISTGQLILGILKALATINEKWNVYLANYINIDLCV